MQAGDRQVGGAVRAVTRRFHLTIALLVLLFLCSGGLLLVHLDRSLDREAAEQASHLAQTALGQLAASDRSHVYDFAYWDDTVAFARGERGSAWADENVGFWSLETYGFDAAFVVGADDRPLYSAAAAAIGQGAEGKNAEVDGANGQGAGDADRASGTLAPAALLGGRAAALIAAARAAPMDDPLPSSAFFRDGEAVYLGVAAAVTPEYPLWAELRPQPRPVLIYARRLDVELLDELAARYLLPNLRLSPAAEPAGGDRLALIGPDGTAVAALAWDPARPGVEALAEAAVPGALVLLLLLALVAAMIVATRLAARTIAQTVEALEDSHRELARRELAAREARDEAERANRIKTVFLANVSHELRTPLNAILGFSELLDRQVKGPLGHPAYRGYITDIRASGQHLLRLIENVIDLSRIEVGAWELDAAPMDPRQTTQEVLRFLQPLAKQRGIELAVELDRAPEAIVADSRALAQIVTNLVSNAIKFTDSGGRVRLAWRVSSAGEAVLQVEDDGIGIPAADMEAILQPFERGRDHSTRRREGSGLGLAIVKSLVELHGGRLSLDSRPGEGTSVTVVLPGSLVPRLDGEPRQAGAAVR